MDLCVFPSFPSLFALADPKEAWVKDVWSRTAKGKEGGAGVELEPLLY